jgi:hypothetical protein
MFRVFVTNFKLPKHLTLPRHVEFDKGIEYMHNFAFKQKTPWTLKLERANGKLDKNEMTYGSLGVFCILTEPINLKPLHGQ